MRNVAYAWYCKCAVSESHGVVDQQDMKLMGLTYLTGLLGT